MTDIIVKDVQAGASRLGLQVEIVRAGTAVASGLLPAAPGSDGGGSIRIPSSVNGVFGIKPSRGRVSAAPTSNEISGLSVHGPIARTVRDAAALLDAMAGPSTQDWIWHAQPRTGSFQPRKS